MACHVMLGILPGSLPYIGEGSQTCEQEESKVFMQGPSQEERLSEKEVNKKSGKMSAARG